MIKVENLGKTYKLSNGSKIDALNDVSISFNDNSFTAIIGRSGSGKTTLLNCIGLLDDCDNGDIYFDDKCISSLNNKELNNIRTNDISFVFQDFQLIDNATVLFNLTLFIDNNDDKSLILQTLKDLGIQDLVNKKVKKLSGGEKQRVAIARALLKNPKYILCDEPTGSLDKNTSEEILNILKKLSVNHTIIMVTHDFDSAQKYADRIIELEEGKIFNDALISGKINEKKSLQSSNKFNNTKLIGLGFKRFFNRPFIIGLIALILVIANSIGITCISSMGVDEPTAIVGGMKKDNCNYFCFKRVVAEHDVEDVQTCSTNLNNEILNEFQDYLGQKVYAVKSYSNFGISSSNINECVSSNDYYRNEVNGYCEIDDTFLDNLNFSILVGRVPNVVNEVLITKYLYESFAKFGYKEKDEQIAKISDYDDMIGKTLTIGNLEHTICGVLDCGESLSTCYQFKDSNSGNNKKTVDQLLGTGPENVLYVKRGYSRNWYDSYDGFIKNDSVYNIDLNVKIGIGNRDISKYLTSTIDNKYTLLDLEFNVINTLPSLKENQIIVPITKYLSGFDFYNDGAALFIEQNYDSFSVAYETDHPDEEYVNYLINNEYSDPIYGHITEEEIYGYGIKAYFNYKIKTKDKFSNAYICLNCDSSELRKEKTNVDIVGFYYDYELESSTSSADRDYAIYCSKDLVEIVNNVSGNYYNDIKYCMTFLPEDISKAIELYQKVITHNEDNGVYYSSYDKSMVTAFESYNTIHDKYTYSYNTSLIAIKKFKSAANYMSIISIVLFVICNIILNIVIIYDNKHLNGILKAFGVNDSKICLMYTLPYALYQFIVLILGNVISCFTIAYLNGLQMKSSNVLFTLFSYSPNLVYISIGLLLVLLVIYALMNFLTILNKKPISLMKRNK